MSRLVFITGASSGIGQALALRYYAAGYSLALVARRRLLVHAWAQNNGFDEQALAESGFLPDRGWLSEGGDQVGTQDQADQHRSWVVRPTREKGDERMHSKNPKGVGECSAIEEWNEMRKAVTSPVSPHIKAR